MLTEKRWSLDALMRLLVRIFVCIFAGSIVLALFQVFRAGSKINFWFFPAAAAALACLIWTLVLVHKPWELGSLMRRLMMLLVSFYSAFFLCAMAQRLAGPSTPSVVQTVITTMSFQGAALLLVWRFLREQGLSWSEAFGLSRRRLNATLFGMTLGCLFFPAGQALNAASKHAITQVTHEETPDQQVVQVIEKASSWYHRAVLGVITILLAPIAEEVLFRGILYQAVKQLGFKQIALWGTSLLFAAIHANASTFLPLFVLSLALTLLYEYTANLLAPIMAHSLFNAINFAYFLLRLALDPS